MLIIDEGCRRTETVHGNYQGIGYGICRESSGGYKYQFLFHMSFTSREREGFENRGEQYP
jgi:hypothetical protein